jgi:hypothetical protein
LNFITFSKDLLVDFMILLCSLVMMYQSTFSFLRASSQIIVKVTLRLTVSHSVCLGVEPLLVLMTRCLLLVMVTAVALRGASLTKGWVCHLSVRVWSI